MEVDFVHYSNTRDSLRLYGLDEADVSEYQREIKEENRRDMMASLPSCRLSRRSPTVSEFSINPSLSSRSLSHEPQSKLYCVEEGLGSH